jgi:hypothetical protein
MTRPYRLISDQLSQDTIECLEKLLNEARSGRLIGIAFAGILKHQKYIHHSCGEVNRQRVLTRGILRELDDNLGQM